MASTSGGASHHAKPTAPIVPRTSSPIARSAASSPGWWRDGRGGQWPRASWLGHRTPLNPTIIDRTITHVTITDTQHCLFGKRLAVFRERSGRGPAYLVVELPDGRKRSIRITSTDFAGTVITSGATPNLPRISVRTLIPLVQHLNANLALLAKEVIRDGSSSPSTSRCVSTTVDACRLIGPASDGTSAP